MRTDSPRPQPKHQDQPPSEPIADQQLPERERTRDHDA
jgi:hypothetical protein